MLEESYQVQYLYNAISEYLYVSILLIETYGSQNVEELEKFSMLFKKELNSFVEIFKGETKSKKIINLISTVTNAFNIQEDIFSLSKTYEKCKRNIFQELMQSNVADIILRGISSIKDICKCINLNSAFHIKEDMLLHMLKQSPFFQIEDDSSVTILEFTGLIGYDDNLYKTITDYFQSYLLKVSSITYDEINLHSSFILSCGIRSPLVILCVFYIDEMFKCKNNKVKVCKNWKARSKNQLKVQIDQLSKNCIDSMPIGEVVFNLYGFTITNFKGEIIRVNKTMGYIHGIVEVHSYVGVFPVFFNMSALKFICGTDNLVDFLSLGDSVEFDAEYCDETIIEERYWKATLVKVTIKSSLGRNNYQVNYDTKEYTEKRLVKEKFKRVPKSLNNCINIYDPKQYLSTSNISSVKENLLSNKEINTWKLKSNNLLDSPHDKPNDKTKLSPTEVSKDGAFDENIKDESIRVLSGHGLHKNSLSEDIYKTCNENGSLSPDTDKMDLQDSLATSPENLVVKNIPITESSFTFGEIVVITDKEGIAISLNSFKQSEVYFKEQSVIYLEDAEISPQEGSKVLLFLPYGLKESSISIATLVYVLDEEESSLVAGNYEWVDDFVVEYFIPKLKLRYPNYINCVCNFGFSISAPSKSLNEESSFPDTLNDLREVSTYDGNTGKNSLGVLKLHLQTSKIDKKKLASFQTSIYSSMDPNIEYTQPKKGHKPIKYSDKLIKKSEAVSQIYNENISFRCPSITVDGMPTENTISSSTVPIKDNKLSTTEVNSRNPSPNSLSSYVSCDTVSDDEFFSLESTSSKSSTNQYTGGKYLASQASKDSPETDISIPEKEGSSITDKSKNQEKIVLTTKKTSLLKNMLSNDNFCQCQYKSVESTASISMITDKCFYLDVKDNKDVALSFPMCLIPEEVQDQIKLNSELHISFALHQLVQVSQILYLKFKLNNKVQFCINRI